MSLPILLFDIDYTLFDTNKYKENTSHFFCTKFHLKKSEMDLFDQDYRSKIHTPFGVNMKDYTDKMEVKFDISPGLLFQLLIDTGELFESTLYSDTLPALSHLSREYTLGIFSQGHVSFQKNKLIKTNILSFFNEKHIYIHPHKMHEEHMSKLPKNAVVIDDKLTVVDNISKHMRTIHVNRKEIKSTHTPSVKNLTEVYNIISL